MPDFPGKYTEEKAPEFIKALFKHLDEDEVNALWQKNYFKWTEGGVMKKGKYAELLETVLEPKGEKEDALFDEVDQGDEENWIKRQEDREEKERLARVQEYKEQSSTEEPAEEEVEKEKPKKAKDAKKVLKKIQEMLQGPLAEDISEFGEKNY